MAVLVLLNTLSMAPNAPSSSLDQEFLPFKISIPSPESNLTGFSASLDG